MLNTKNPYVFEDSVKAVLQEMLETIKHGKGVNDAEWNFVKRWIVSVNKRAQDHSKNRNSEITNLSAQVLAEIFQHGISIETKLDRAEELIKLIPI